MDDIGNLVYILVFIIWFLYRTFSKGGKKPATGKKLAKPTPARGRNEPDRDFTRQRGPSESTTPPVTFEDILRELTGAPQDSREPQTVEEIPEDYTDYNPETEEETSFEVLEPIAEQPKPEIQIPTLPGPKLTERFKEFEIKKQRSSKAAREAVKMFRSPQGARQAFLMKEIFDRKYF